MLVVRRSTRSLRTLVIAAAVLLGALAVVAPRLGDVLDRTYGASSRLDEWRVAVRVIVEHQWFGVGPEGYRIAFAEGVDDAYEQSYGRSVLPDRAHSGPLDVAVTLGIPAALLWGVGVAAIGRASWRAARRADAVLGGLAAGVAAYLVQQLFLFPIAELDVLAWGVGGLVVAGTSPATEVTANRLPRLGLSRLAGVGTGLLVAGAFVFGIREVVADRYAREAADALAQAETGSPAAHEAVRAAATAIAWRGDVLRTRLLLARAEEATGTLAGTDRAIRQTERALAVSPGDPIVRTESARLLSARAAITGTSADASAALDQWVALVADDPHRSDWHLGAGQAAAAAGDAGLASFHLRRAVELAPDKPRAAELLAELARLGSNG